MFAFRISVPLAAIFCALLAVASVDEARAGLKEDVKELGEKLKMKDPDQRVPKTVGQLTAANCSVDAALHAIFTGDNEIVIKMLTDASNNYGAAASRLESFSKQDRFQKEFSDSLKGLLHLSGLFLTPPVNEANLLQRIAVLAREAEAAAKRIASGKGSEADLTTVVQNSSRISRLIALFFQVVVHV